MKSKKKRQHNIFFTDRNARLSRILIDAWAGHYGRAVQAYLDQYIKLKAQSYKLQKKGLKVQIVLPDFPRRPLLVIEK
jgi:hypothetical protein